MIPEILKTRAEQGFADQFIAGKAGLPGAGNAWVEGLRDTAWKTYAATGLPHRRVEEWKYTDLRTLLRDAYPPAPALAEALNADDIAQALGPDMAGIDCHLLVVVDGHFRAGLSDVNGLADRAKVHSLGDALGDPEDWLKRSFEQAKQTRSDPVLTLLGLLLGLVVGFYGAYTQLRDFLRRGDSAV